MSSVETVTRVSDYLLPAGAMLAEEAAAPKVPASSSTYRPGAVLLTSFRIEALVGSGGMGSVYRATHLLTGATVAIKTIRSEYAADPRMAGLFRREAQALRRIAHPAIVRYEGAFAADDGHMILVMEFVEGPSLMDVLRRGPLPAKAVAALRERLAAGLAAAHREGVVHRDLSPDNVILPGGRIEDAKIIDFGIALQERSEGATLLGSDFAGKLAWAAPEQFGLFGGTVDHRADIFSLGLVLAAAAIGRPLEMGTSVNSAVRARGTAPDLSGLPAALRKSLQPMLQPDPSKRPVSLEGMLPVDQRAAWIGARRWRWLAAACLVVALGTTALSVWEVDIHDHVLARVLGTKPAAARKPTATVAIPPVPTVLPEVRYGGTACHAGHVAPCGSGILTVRQGRLVGSWPAADDRLTNIVEGSIDEKGVVRLRWRRVDAGENLLDQAHLTGTITAARLQAAGKWMNEAADVQIVWTRIN